MRVIITGGTGLIGRALAASLLRDDHEVIVLSREPARGKNMEAGGAQVVRWDGRSADGWGQYTEGADAIVNLAGDNLSSGRWTDEKKKSILESRVLAGQAVTQAVEMTQAKPKVVVQVSGIGYYGVTDPGVLTEESPKGTDFLAGVCEAWENATAGVERMGVRRVVARCAVVLDRKEGALPRMALPFRLFAGGPIGSGRQWMPWVHIDDVVGVFRHLIENGTAVGVYNLAAPQPVTNREFSKALGRAMRRPAWMPVPAFVLKLIFGEMSTVLLDGQQAIPKRLQEEGYPFEFGTLDAALADLFRPRT